MTNEEVQIIHDSTLDLLERVGIRLEHDEIVDLIIKAGAKPGLKSQEVLLPRQLVSDYLEMAPRQVVLDDRQGGSSVLSSDSASVFWTNPGMQILENNLLRSIQSNDLAGISRLCQHLENVQGVMGMAMADVSPQHRDFVGVRVIAENCRKHVRALCFTPKGMEALSEMKKIFPGNWLSIGFTAHGPLRWTNLALDIFKKSSGHRIPMTINGEPMAGVTGPVSLAGSVVVGNAEILSGIVVNQLLEPGRPVIYNLGLAHTFDMKHATAVTGGPENALFARASAALGRFYDLPSSSWVSTDSLFDDSQAALEKMFGFQTHTSEGVSLIWGMGQLESEKTISLKQLVIDNEMINYTRRFQRGLNVDEESIQSDLITEVGICGSFLESDHTLQHFREELWEPRILNRRQRDSSQFTLEERAQSELEQILNREFEPVLTPEESSAFRTIESFYGVRA